MCKALFRDIVFKPGEDEAAQSLCDTLDELGKVAATSIQDGKKHIIARFDDSLDYLAFLVSIGTVKMTVQDAKRREAGDER